MFLTPAPFTIKVDPTSPNEYIPGLRHVCFS
jgi:hypothetical protein